MEEQLGGPVAEIPADLPVPHTPAGIPDAEAVAPPDDSSEDSDLPVVELCAPSQKRAVPFAIRGHGPQKRYTTTNASCVPLPTSWNLPISTVQLDLAASDYQTTGTPVSSTTAPAAMSTLHASAVASAPAPSESDDCNVKYDVLFDRLTIEGKDFPPGKLDKDDVQGDGLKQQLKGCGDLTDWKFQTLTNDPDGMQWKATGNLPIGKTACVGRALESAGGNSKSQCTGAG